MIKALVFDFDGLILETETPIYQSWQELFQRYRCEMPLESWLLNVGTSEEQYNPVVELERMIGCPIDRELELPRRLRRELELIGEQPPMPGVEATLKKGKELGLKIGLASSSSCDWVTGHLGRLGLIDYFDAIVARDDVHRTKPDPALYRTAVELLGVRPEEAVAFEDSLHGLKAAHSAGLLCVVVPTDMTRGMPLGGADLWLNSLADEPLEHILQRLNGKNPE